MKNVILILSLLSVPLLVACGQKMGPEPPGATALPPTVAPASPPVNPPFMQGPATNEPTEQGKPLPLKLSGMNSAEELNRALTKLADAGAKRLFEEAFRETFTADQSGRSYADAETKFRQVLAMQPRSAETYRGLGYALFNQGQTDGATENYLKAIEIDPNYGEAHYAVAFLYAMGDTAKGKQHYQKAMQLGIPDERKLGDRFYK